MNLTPQQIDAYLELNYMLDNIERSNDLWVAGMGAQSDAKGLEKAFRDLANG
jgi:hypothetical protein